MDVANRVNEMLTDIWRISLNKNGHRSNKKTNHLHSQFIHLLESELAMPEAQFYIEDGSTESKKKLKISDMFDSAFNVDAICQVHGETRIIFLFKAPLTSINKNRFNSINSMIGEFNRIAGNPANANVQVAFVNFVPAKTLVAKPQENEYGVESVKYFNIEAFRSRVGVPNFYRASYYEFCFEYDIPNIEQCVNKDALLDLFTQNSKEICITRNADTQMERMVQLIKAQATNN